MLVYTSWLCFACVCKWVATLRSEYITLFFVPCAAHVLPSALPLSASVFFNALKQVDDAIYYAIHTPALTVTSGF